MEKQWYFNTVTEQPELGMISPASHRMGPYRTREDALDAWKIVQERNLKWEEQTANGNAGQRTARHLPKSEFHMKTTPDCDLCH